MKKKLAILYSGFMCYYLNYFLDLCHGNNIDVDLFLPDDENIEHKGISKKYIYKTKLNTKNINSLKQFEEEIKNLVNIDDYYYLISDSIAFPFSCNIVHNHSFIWRINTWSNFLYRKILELGHFNRINTEKEFYKYCPKIIAVSNIVKEDIIKSYNISSNKIAVVHPGMNTEINKINDKRENDKFIIGSVTCGFNTKGGYIVLEAVRKLLKRKLLQDIEVRLINPKIDKQLFLKLYIKFFKLEKYVKFYPYQKDIKKFYNELDCLICASKYEAFGRVVSEAMINRVPVIAGSNVGASDIIKDDDNGFIFIADKNREKNLADKLENLINNYKKYSYIKDNAYNTAINLTWENFASGLFRALYSNY